MGFMQFENTEQMVNWMAQRTAEANQGLAPEQSQITWGDYWVRFDHLDSIGVIVGKVETLETFIKEERDNGADEQEVTYNVDRITQSHANGYMEGYAYSRIEPEGEWGQTHRANMWPIDPELFLYLHAAGWRHEYMSLDQRINLSIAFEEWRQHEEALIGQARKALAEEKEQIERES